MSDWGEPVELDVDSVSVIVSNPNKVMFGRRGETKMDLVEYYLAVCEPMLKVIGGRPAMLQRFPNGASGKSFFQKRVPQGAPAWLETTTVATPNGTESQALVLADAAHVVWAANLGSLGFHVWPYLATRPEFADELRIDLDPHGAVGFDEVRAAALLTKALLDEIGIVSWVKTTGSKGLHIYVKLAPRWNSYQVRSGAVALARELERRHPDHLTAKWWKEERGDRVFVDFNQNAPHKTVFAAWSVRARAGAQVSTPLSWNEVDRVAPNDLTIASVPDRISDVSDPWAGYNDSAETLEPLLEMHHRDMQSGLLDAPWPPVYPKQPNEPPRVAPSRARKS